MWITLIITFIVFLDQISKHYAVLYLCPNRSADFIPGILSFRYHENKGAAWGMFADNQWIFMTASTLAILFILGFFLYMKIKKETIHPLLLTSLSFFAGGGIGNMIDRIKNGYVVDFFRFDFIEFPIFNVADSFISVGAFLIVLYLILDTVKDIKSKKQKELNKNYHD